MTELNEKFNELQNSWENFKQVNDERLQELEKKSQASAMTEEKIENLNNLINKQQEEIKRIKANNFGSLIEVKSIDNNIYEDLEYKAAFDNYIRRGVENDLVKLEKKSEPITMSTADTAGGYLMYPNIQKLIIDRLAENCVMRKICSVQEISTGSLDVITNSEFSANWNAEDGTVSDTNGGVLTRKTIPTYDLMAQPKVTQKLLDDYAINFEEWLAMQLSEQFLVAEETAFISGNGIGKPKGILNYSNSDVARMTATTTNDYFNENDILSFYYSLDERYVKNASFLMSRSTEEKIRKLKDSTSGQYLWNPSLLSDSQGTLLGCPVYTTPNLDAVGTSKECIIFGDFKYYQIVDRMGIKILRDPYTAKPFVRFYTTKKVGGDVIKPEAFKVFKTSTYTVA